MIPTMVRSEGNSLLPAASRAAEEPTQITQSPGMQPMASTATWRAPPAFSRTTSRGRWPRSAMRLVDTKVFSTCMTFMTQSSTVSMGLPVGRSCTDSQQASRPWAARSG